MSRLVFTAPAVQDFERIYEYIASDDVAAADRHREELKACCRLLLGQPRIGSKRSDIHRDMRSIAVGNYVIFYRQRNAGVEIVRVLHAAQDVRRAFNAVYLPQE